MEFLNHKVPEIWIGRDRTVTWPHLSDFTSFDFLVLGGYIKNAVYMQPASTFLTTCGIKVNTDIISAGQPICKCRSQK
jgi:hypothetical protein